jgi:polyisoprenoid-binding protein YceI
MKKLSASVRRHPVIITLCAVVLAVAAYVGWDVASLYFTPDVKVDQAMPVAPRLTAATSDQVVYRVDPSRSSASYEVKEELAGLQTTAKGTTHGIASDILIDRQDPAQSRLGEVVVNVEQLTSDSTLRDKRIRTEYLESHEHPLVKLSNAQLDGLPASIADGQTASFTITGDLTVHDVTRKVTWKATASIKDDTLIADATATVKMSDFGVGPITLIGLVRTSDDVTLHLSLVAPKNFDPPTKLTSTVRAATAGNGPSFSKDVQPILESNCAGCHNPGELGEKDWRLDTAADASQVATGLAQVTQAKYMPPWPASDKGIPLAHPRGLTSSQIKTIADWAKAGGTLDVPKTTKIRPRHVKDDAPKPRDDLDLRPAKAYAGDGTTKVDDYRCFILDPKFAQTSYMTGYSFVPDHSSVVHHALIYEMKAKSRDGADRLDGADGHPGWSCYGGPGMSGTGGGFGDLVAGWVPGQRPLDFGHDAGFRFDPGDFLVLQVHYHYSSGHPLDRSTMKLQVSTKPTTPLKVRTMLGPVEIPCESGQTAPLCNRDAAIQDVGQRFPGMGFVEDGLLGLCNAKVSDFAQFTNGVASSTCTYPVRQNAEIVDVLGHMHQTGKAFRMTLNPGRPDQKILLDIPRWDFDWQLNYQPVDPVPVKPGDTIRIDCSWDKSLQPANPPRYVVFAEGTQDEMCFSTATFLPKS